jgi:hypothetical protein
MTEGACEASAQDEAWREVTTGGARLSLQASRSEAGHVPTLCRRLLVGCYDAINRMSANCPPMQHIVEGVSVDECVKHGRRPGKQHTPCDAI